MKLISIHGKPQQLQLLLHFFDYAGFYVPKNQKRAIPKNFIRSPNRCLIIERNDRLSSATLNSRKSKWCNKQYHLPEDLTEVLNLKPQNISLSTLKDKYYIRHNTLYRVVSAQQVAGLRRLSLTPIEVETGEVGYKPWLCNTSPFLNENQIEKELIKLAQKKFGKGDYFYISNSDTLIKTFSYTQKKVYQKGNWKNPQLYYNLILKDDTGSTIDHRQLTKSQLKRTISDPEILEKINE